MNTLAEMGICRQNYSTIDKETTNGSLRNATLVDRKSHLDRSPTTITENNLETVIVAAPITSMANSAAKMYANAKWLVWIVRAIRRSKIQILDEDQKHDTINLNQVNIKQYKSNNHPHIT